MPASLRADSSAAICKRLLELPVFLRAAQALFFITHGSEVETQAMRKLTRDLGMRVAAPRCEPKARSLRFHGLEEPETLVLGPYGIQEPAGDAPLADLRVKTVVLVPGSVFDRRGNRLGMGGGYYDRWLAGEGRGLPTLGLAFHGQLVDQVPTGPLDIPVQWLVTDRETIDCRASL